MEVSETFITTPWKTFFKSNIKPPCIDIPSTNIPLTFPNTCTIANALSDFHKMVVSALKVPYEK